MSSEQLFQRVFDKLLVDERLQCTCDESYRDSSHYQALGHYKHCCLHQVAKAIQLTHREIVSWEGLE